MAGGLSLRLSSWSARRLSSMSAARSSDAGIGSNIDRRGAGPSRRDGVASSDRRLFVANLAPVVSEHDLMSVFKAHGSLSKLDLVFQRSGPQKGQHKGYGFVEFRTPEQADRACRALDGTPLRGRELRITYATAPPLDTTGAGEFKRPKKRSARDEDGSKPTLLSLSKNLNRKDSTTSKIAAMEAKLAALQKRDGAAPESGTPLHAPRPAHLPPKPPGR